MKSTFKLFILSLFVVSFTAVGCGDKEGNGDDADTTGTSSTDAGGSGGATAADFKQGMIDLSKQMIDITEDIESVEDAQEAEPKIEKAMNDIVALFTRLADNIDKMTVAELRELQNLQTIMEDPEVKEWMDKAQAASDKLKADHPDAAAKLEEIGNKHGEKMMGAMMGAMMKIGQKVGMENMDGSMGDVDTSEDTTANQ